jgi:hypothetical protein
MRFNSEPTLYVVSTASRLEETSAAQILFAPRTLLIQGAVRRHAGFGRVPSIGQLCSTNHHKEVSHATSTGTN